MLNAGTKLKNDECFCQFSWNREWSCAFFHAEAADYAEIFSAVCAVAGLVASFATTEVAEVGMAGSVLLHAEVGMI